MRKLKLRLDRPRLRAFASNGILWGPQSNGATNPGTLHAYNPATLQKEYNTSHKAGTRDQLDPWLNFTPTVANDHVYVVSQGSLTAAGLLP